MYFPFPVNLRNDREQTEMFKNCIANKEYYYVIEKGNASINYERKTLDAFRSAKKVSDFSDCDLVLLGRSRNQLMPPHFGVMYNAKRACVAEFISYLFNETSIENDILMLIQYLQAKHADIKELIIPSSIIFESNLYEVSNTNEEKIISWQ